MGGHWRTGVGFGMCRVQGWGGEFVAWVGSRELVAGVERLRSGKFGAEGVESGDITGTGEFLPLKRIRGAEL